MHIRRRFRPGCETMEKGKFGQNFHLPLFLQFNFQMKELAKNGETSYIHNRKKHHIGNWSLPIADELLNGLF